LARREGFDVAGGEVSSIRRQRDRERGAVTPAIAVATMLASVLSIGGITLGTIAVNRADAQRAADAATLAALGVIRERGLPFDTSARAAAESIANGNSRKPIRYTWSVAETTTGVDITAVTSLDVDTPLLVWSTSSTEVRARAVAHLPQTRFDSAERRLPKLALVLDYSGSMDLPFSGGSRRAIEVLEDSVAALLNANLEIDYAGVLYSTNVFRTIPVGAGAPNALITAMNTYDAGGSTNTAAGLGAARNLLLAAADTGRYVLLVSDGEPCCESNAFAQARAAAQQIWNAGMTIFTLEIRRSGSSSALDRFMTDVAGTPTSRGDRNYHYVATSAADLVDEFRRIVSTIVCKVGPLSPAPSDPGSLRVFLRQGGVERVLPPSADLAADRDLERYQYEAGDASVRLTSRACDAVVEGASIVVRDARPRLTQ
jgi:hypothetical protein